MELVFTIITLLFISLLTGWYMKNRRYIKLMEKFPNPPTVPIFGNALDFKSPTVFISKFEEYTKLYGDIVKLYFGPIATKLLISDIKLVGHILSSTSIMKKGEEYRYTSKWLGNGILQADGDSRWKKHRKLAAATFNVQILRNFIEVFESNTKILINKLESELGKSSFDIYPYITLCSLDIICETIMDTSIHAQEDIHSDYVHSVKLMCRLLMKRAFNAILRIDSLYKFSSLYKLEKRAIEILHGHTMDVIRKRQEQNRNDVNPVTSPDTKRRLVLLDLLLQANETSDEFTLLNIREEVDTFMFAGHDTTASALSFTIFCLAQNPLVQANVMNELNEIFGNDSRPVTFNDVQSMRYLDAVIKESLRLYPSVPYYSRTVEKDFDFEDHTIPEGVSIIFNVYGIHHNPTIFPDPECFKPERFLNDNPNEGYFAFSSGPRNCIGQKFAMLEMKTILAVLLRRYEILEAIPKHKLRLSTETVMLSENGVHVRIAKRNSSSSNA